MKISDYFTQVLKANGVRYVFGLQGSGTAVQMFDSIARCEGIDYVCTLHEQTAGMAADGYAAVTGGLGACVVDSGPAATNLYTSIAGSYYESRPVIYIIAQPQTSLLRKDLRLRHYGFHEAEIIQGFSPITKYTVQVTDPSRVRYEIEKAIYIAQSGRPGPVVLAMPDDITWLQTDPETLEGFTPEFDASEPNLDISFDTKLSQCIDMLKNSERPTFILGNGVRLSKAVSQTKELAEKLGIPIAPTFALRDAMPDNHPLFAGSFGVQGSRSGNFTVQNSDLIIVLGSRLDPSETGLPTSNFARNAKVVVVDIDTYELEKMGQYGIKCDLPIKSDIRIFVEKLSEKINSANLKPKHSAWCEKVGYWKRKYPLFKPEYYKEETVNPYSIVEQLSLLAGSNDVLLIDIGLCHNFILQAFKCKEGQRLIAWTNFACLGYGLPAAIGACYAHDGQVIAVMGDGGLQFNIQELATVIFNNLNMKIIVFDNDGFGLIQYSQNNFLDRRHEATDREHGLPLPNSAKIAQAYGFPVIEIFKNEELASKMEEALSMNGPVFCCIHLSIKHWTNPCRKGKDPIEDMTPKLPRDEFYNEMIVPPIS